MNNNNIDIINMSLPLSYTCLTCRVSFTTPDLQRDHYKSEWHSYNLKRKLVQLPAVSYDQFLCIEAQHVSHQNESKTHSKTTKDRNDKTLYCESCHKQFNNEKALEQHFQSKKHLNSVDVKDDRNASHLKKVETKRQSSKSDSKVIPKILQNVVNEDNEDNDDSDWDSVDSDELSDGEEEAILPNECLFCDISSDNLSDNILHMSAKHSFFIPDIEYLTDLEGLIRYLGQKIGCGHCCLWCCDSGKQFRSKKSAQQHMTDKGHTKMLYQCQPSANADALLEYSDFFDYSKSYPDSDGRAVDSDEEVFIPQLEDADYELTLPSGAVIGHRSLFRYYKQNLKPLTDSLSYSKSSAILGKVMSQYRALGWTGITGEAAIQKAKDIQFMQRIQRRHALKLGQKNNRIMQTHFRSQIGF